MSLFKRRLDFDAEDIGQELRFHRLADYNGEKSRGLVHTPEKDAEMRLIQQEYDDHGDNLARKQGFTLTGKDSKGKSIWVRY